MAEGVQTVPPETGVAEERETILIVAPDGKRVRELQHQLRSGGYQLLHAVGGAEAIGLLGSRNVRLVIVNIHGVKRSAPEEKLDPRKASSETPIALGEMMQPESYRLCHTVRTAAASNAIPTLLVCSLWDEAALVWGLATEADYILFAPYQSADLRRAIRDAILNGPVREPESGSSPVEIIHQDRRHMVAAGRNWLARLSFSLFDELRQCRASLFWSQAEVQALRRQLREERRQWRRGLHSTDVLQGIAHDFSNLLETVSAAATVLRSGPPQPQPYWGALDAALAQVGELLTTLQNRTDVEAERKDIRETEAVDLAQAAQEVLEAALLALRAPNILVRLQLQGLPPVSASPPLIMRILSNLVWNAVEAMPAGGRLSLLGYQHRNRVVLEVSDTGVGISTQEQEKIFKTNYSTKQGHAGMGLLLVHSLVQRAGGEITFVSSPGRGSTFALSFPVASHFPAVAPTTLAGGHKVSAR